MNAKCILFTGVSQVEIGETELPSPDPDDLVLETIMSCISPGTELRCLAGAQEGLGRHSFPIIPGYATVGRVLRADKSGRHPQGSLVFSTGNRNASVRCAWGGHLSHAVVPAASAYAIPATISLANASLLKLAAIAHRGLRLSGFQAGEKVIVVGLGPIGQLAARLFQAAGAEVLGTDLSIERVAVAKAAGLTALQLGANGDVSAVRALMPAGAEIVVDATGYAPAIHTSAELVVDRPWNESNPAPGRLIIQGSYGADLLFPQGIAFLKELQVIWPRDSQVSDLEAVGRSMVSGALTAEDLVSHVHPVADAPQVYAELQGAKKGLLTAVFDWRL